MANPEHVEIVKQGSDAILSWRNENPAKRLDLVEANLRGVILRGLDLRRADLRGARLRVADLCDADLRNAMLRGAILRGTMLIQANLSGVNLRGADLRGAVLRRANLGDADLSGANLSDADLRKTKLSGVDLNGAILSGVNLSRADLSQADCWATVFADVDLASVTGLETIRHSGPSTIGIDTLYKSRGKIPKVFLRGCGVPEKFIHHVLSFTNQPIEFYSCFISYSHADKSFARRLHDSLQGRGIRCWLDEHQMLPGDDIYEHVDRGIRLWDKVLLCASKASLTSEWVDREIDTAIEKELQLRQERGEQTLAIIPLNLDDYFFEWSGSHGATLRKRLAANFVGWESDNELFEREFENVVKALRADVGGREPPPKAKL